LISSNTRLSWPRYYIQSLRLHSTSAIKEKSNAKIVNLLERESKRKSEREREVIERNGGKRERRKRGGLRTVGQEARGERGAVTDEM